MTFASAFITVDLASSTLDPAGLAHEAAEDEAHEIAMALAVADLEGADDASGLARKALADTENFSGVLSCEWRPRDIMDAHGCSEATALRAAKLYRAALLRAAEEYLSA